MTQFGRRWGVMSLFVLAAWFLASLIQSHDAYAESKKVSGTGVGTILGQRGIQMLIGDMNHHIGNLRNRLWVYESTDSDWNNATAFSVAFIDGMTKSSKGFTVVTHPGGDQTFLEFEGTFEIEPVVGSTAQRKGWFLGGTGKFKGITGRWTSAIRGEGSMYTIERKAAWEAEYEIKP